jgi:diadenosine tetraphosphate (Ap4A) HIT family hydrolase
MTFETDPRLLANSVAVASLALCDLRLIDDARFPWLVMIPRVAGASELDDLSPDQQATLMTEIVAAGAMVRKLGEATGRPVDKVNTAALGNVTAQLHVHVVGRRRDDPLWPDPIWGRGGGEPWPEGELDRLAGLIRA